MADEDKNRLLPTWVGEKDRVAGRKLRGQVIDDLSFEKHYRVDADGKVVRYETKGGMPRIYTEVPEAIGSEPVYSGITVWPQQVDAAIATPSLLKVSHGDRPLEVGVKNPWQARGGTKYSYAILAGASGGLAVVTAQAVRCFWFYGDHKRRRGMFTWKRVDKKTITPDDKDDLMLPFARRYVATQHRVLTKDNKVAYEMEIPTRQVYLDAGERPYDLLPPQVSYDFKQAVMRCSDSQTFQDRPEPGVAVITDLTRYFRSAVFNVKTLLPTVTDRKLEVFLPAPDTDEEVNGDGYSLSSGSACFGYRPYWDYLDSEGNITTPNYVRVTIETGSGFLGEPARADATVVKVLATVKQTPFADIALETGTGTADYVAACNYVSNEVVEQQYSSTGMTDPFLSVTDRLMPYQYSLTRDVFKGRLNSTEELSVSAEVRIAAMAFPIFSASGASGTSADKAKDTRHEYFHPPNGTYDDGTWDSVIDTQGLTIGKALEDACGYSYGEMIGWSELSGTGTNKVIDVVDSETPTRTSSCAFSATGSYYLAVDALLEFSAAVEFHFDYSFSATSSDPDWKWTLPEEPPASPVNATVTLVVKLRGVEHRQTLFSGTLIMPPPVTKKAYPNPYYFVPLHYGVAPADAIIAAGADVCWSYRVPKFEPQPSFFNSLDTIIGNQQTSRFVAGYSDFEFDSEDTTERTVVSSRRIKLREANADWLFSYYKIDRPLSLDVHETDPTKTRKYGYSDDLYNLMFKTTLRFEFDNAGLRYWIEDINDAVVDPSEDKNAYCFRI